MEWFPASSWRERERESWRIGIVSGQQLLREKESPGAWSGFRLAVIEREKESPGAWSGFRPAVFERKNESPGAWGWFPASSY